MSEKVKKLQPKQSGKPAMEDGRSGKLVEDDRSGKLVTLHSRSGRLR